MTIHNSVSELRKLRDELVQIDFGYPLGNNTVSISRGNRELTTILKRVENDAAREHLASLYAECNGFSFPDVHVGYFIKTIAKLESFSPSSEPDKVLLDRTISVLPLGSTGGGSLFVLCCQTGKVMLLPSGPLNDGLYDGTYYDVREIAKNLEQFIERLTADVRAFVKGMEHRYLA